MPCLLREQMTEAAWRQASDARDLLQRDRRGQMIVDVLHGARMRSSLLVDGSELRVIVYTTPRARSTISARPCLSTAAARSSSKAELAVVRSTAAMPSAQVFLGKDSPLAGPPAPRRVWRRSGPSTHPSRASAATARSRHRSRSMGRRCLRGPASGLRTESRFELLDEGERGTPRRCRRRLRRRPTGTIALC